tara:strand:+ start:8022 stop:8285 length:264 start_codon:yes stop_codon:yes gene_type:complete
MASAVRDGDSAGGSIRGSSSNVFIGGRAAALDGDSVMPHGDDRHKAGPRMRARTSNVFANNKPMCKAGDTVTCGHKAKASQSKVRIN